MFHELSACMSYPRGKSVTPLYNIIERNKNFKDKIFQWQARLENT